MIVERYPFPNGVVGGSTPVVKSPLYLMKWKLARWVGSQELIHHKEGNKSHPARRGFLSKVRPTGSNSRRIAWRWLFMYLFIYLNSYTQPRSLWICQVLNPLCKCKLLTHFYIIAIVHLLYLYLVFSNNVFFLGELLETTSRSLIK